jgi:hypothetical protein
VIRVMRRCPLCRETRAKFTICRRCMHASVAHKVDTTAKSSPCTRPGCPCRDLEAA